MKYRNYVQCVLLSVVVLGSGIASADEPETKMGEEMGEVSKQLKALRTLPKDDFQAAAEAVRNAQKALLRSMAEVPAMVKEMPEGLEKKKATADANRLLGLSYAALSELELAYLSEDPAKIEEASKKLKSIKKEGHKKYTDD